MTGWPTVRVTGWPTVGDELLSAYSDAEPEALLDTHQIAAHEITDAHARALAAVQALHRPEDWDDYGTLCHACGSPWPCATARVIEEAMQP